MTDKAEFDAEWQKLGADKRLEFAYKLWCEIKQLRSQTAKRINEGNAEFWELKNENLERKRKDRRGGLVRAANDPKRAAFREVRKEWEGWRHKKRYKAAFARSMLEKYPMLESQKTIEDKCREWENEEAAKSVTQ